MQIIKPLRIGYMSKPVPDRPQSRLALTGLVCFDLLDPETLYTEQSMWNAITPELGEQGVLDLWMPKRRGEVLLWGHAAASGGVAVTQMQASLQIGETIQKTLTVHGDRHWEPTLLSARISKPTPFTTMPLTYERAFGGPQHVPNPAGKGHAIRNRLDTGASVALPNLEYASNPLLHPNQEPVPACFMPFNPSWPGRAPKGTYDDAWISQRYPAMPLDFDWDIYNLAPLDQRIPGYFRGDEDIQLSGFHPDHSKILSRLPGLAMRFFSLRNGSEVLEESPAVLDSVCLFPSVLRGVLIYRCELELQTNYEAQDVASIMLACERKSATRSLEYYKEVFRLRSGEDRGLYALSDFQLMPPFSEKDRQRLEERREEVRQERAELRIRKKQWFAAVAASSVGFSLPEGFFEHADEPDEIEVPILTDLDSELGNVDLAGVKQAVSAIAEKLRRESEEMRKDAEQHFASAKLQTDAAREAGSSGNFAPLIAMFPPEEREVDVSPMVSSLRGVAARVEAEPAWPLTQAAMELAKPFQQDALAQASQFAETLTPSDKAELLRGMKALSPDAETLASEADESLEARHQFVTTLRAIAAALNGESDQPEDGSNFAAGQGEADQFLQSMGLGKRAQQDRQPEASFKPDVFFQELAASLRTAPPDQLGGILTSLLSGLPGAENIDLSPIQDELQQAAHAQREVFRKLGETFESPVSPDQMRKQMASALDFQQITASASESTDATGESAVMTQVQMAQKRIASSIAAIAPDAVSEDTVNWERFLGSIGVGDEPLKLPEIPSGPPESEAQQALRRALALASDAPGTYRIGPDVPPETAEKTGVRQSLDDFFNQRDSAAIASSNAFSSEFLQAHQDAVREEGSLTAKARQKITDRMLAYAQKQPAMPIDLSAARKETVNALIAGAASGAFANNILRDVLPGGEEMFRKGRQQAPVPLIEFEDLTEEISSGVGAVVRQEAERGTSLAGRDLAGADLRGAKLAGIDLTGAFLEHADLAGADLSDAQCEGAVFSGACLEGTNFRRAYLKDANFGEVRAAKSDFSGADLTDANFFQADFTSADLSHTRLGKCNALKAILTAANLNDSSCEGGVFLQANLAGTSLARARWHKAIFIEAKISGSSAHEANLSECVFSATEADFCDFSNAVLDGMMAIGCSFKGLIAAGARATRSSWAQSELGGANFSKACLEQSNFMKAGLNDADFSAAMLRRAIFLHASLRGACLAGSQLYEASLRGTDLTGADLRFSNLHCADLENATLDLCDMGGSRRIQSILESPSALAKD